MSSMKRIHEDCYLPEQGQGAGQGGSGEDAEDEEASIPGMPQKKFYRSRAHCNPVSE
jgi:hypothetical protein